MAKFEIFQSSKDEKYYFRLKARNGITILASLGFNSKDDCFSTIDSLQQSGTTENMFEKKIAKSGDFYFSLLSDKMKIIGNSQMYKHKSSMNKAVNSVTKNAPIAKVIEIS